MLKNNFCWMSMFIVFDLMIDIIFCLLNVFANFFVFEFIINVRSYFLLNDSINFITFDWIGFRLWGAFWFTIPIPLSLLVAFGTWRFRGFNASSFNIFFYLSPGLSVIHDSSTWPSLMPAKDDPSDLFISFSSLGDSWWPAYSESSKFI